VALEALVTEAAEDAYATPGGSALNTCRVAAWLGEERVREDCMCERPRCQRGSDSESGRETTVF